MKSLHFAKSMAENISAIHFPWYFDTMNKIFHYLLSVGGSVMIKDYKLGISRDPSSLYFFSMQLVVL